MPFTRELVELTDADAALEVLKHMAESLRELPAEQPCPMDIEEATEAGFVHDDLFLKELPGIKRQRQK